MNQGLRGDGAGEDVDEDWPSHDKRIVGDVNGFDFPLPEGSVPGGIALLESQSAPAQVLPQDGDASPQKPSFNFFRSNGFIQQKMDTGGLPGAHKLGRRARGVGCAR